METRYKNSIGALTEQEYRRLREKRVFVAGCGGLGGYLIEHLLRLGVKGITVCDGDVFEPSNLNRQLLCTPEVLGRSKAETAARRAAQVNPEVQVRALPVFLTAENAQSLLAGHDLALDALDNWDSRLISADACAACGIPMVCGAVQGWYAQITVLPPGDPLLERIYPQKAAPSSSQGSLSCTCALCAALQITEAVKLLCGRPSPLTGKVLYADLLRQDYQLLTL